MENLWSERGQGDIKPPLNKSHKASLLGKWRRALITRRLSVLVSSIRFSSASGVKSLLPPPCCTRKLRHTHHTTWVFNSAPYTSWSPPNTRGGHKNTPSVTFEGFCSDKPVTRGVSMATLCPWPWRQREEKSATRAGGTSDERVVKCENGWVYCHGFIMCEHQCGVNVKFLR